MGLFLTIDFGRNSPQKSMTMVDMTVSVMTDPFRASDSHPAACASRRSRVDMLSE